MAYQRSISRFSLFVLSCLLLVAVAVFSGWVVYPVLEGAAVHRGLTDTDRSSAATDGSFARHR